MAPEKKIEPGSPHTDDALTKKKKRRIVGRFPCLKCPKVFTRSDHLNRHYLNHQPKEVFVCDHIITSQNGLQRLCGKTFVRRDLRERHQKRHAERLGPTPDSVTTPKEELGLQPQYSASPSEPASEMVGSPLLISNLIEKIPIPNPVQQIPAPVQPNPPFEYDKSRPAVKDAMPPPQMALNPPAPPRPDLFYAYPSRGPLVYNAQVPNGPEGPRFAEYRNPQNYVQSQSDLITWLFTDSPENMRQNYTMTSSSPVSTNSRVSETQPMVYMPRNQQSPPPMARGLPSNEPNWAPMPDMADPMLNFSLQDLNYFSNNDNPLDEVFLKLEKEQFAALSRDKTFRNINFYSTASSSSPTSTNESVTPVSLTDAAHFNDKSSIEERLLHFSKSFDTEESPHFRVDELVWDKVIAALPSVSSQSVASIFGNGDSISLPLRISFYLHAYWEFFHPRFPILHKPSFSTATAEPLLVLSMLMIGCMYGSPALQTRAQKNTEEFQLCILIAKPLRFELFQHSEFKSPVRVWILQCLNLLEWCEKNFLPRAMHERAHLHHATTVQLLRRSPFLGGNPSAPPKSENLANETGNSAGEESSDGLSGDMDETASGDQILFAKWVESELMKRITFMTFYLDIMDYIKFRHNPQISFFQLQLVNLPCDEDHLWDSFEVNGSFRKVVKRQKKLLKLPVQGIRGLKENARIKPGMRFLAALKKLFKPQRDVQFAHHNNSLFTKNILLAGIVSVMHQMQQTELQSTFTMIATPEKHRKSVWKDLLIKAYDLCYVEILSDTNSSSHMSSNNTKSSPMYHLLQIIGLGDINHYDVAIFGGSPRNMSVDATSKDYNIVQQKLARLWQATSRQDEMTDLVNKRCVIHCFWLLWNVMLLPLDSNGATNGIQRQLNLSSELDCYDTMYAVSVATLVLWCYVFSTEGPESSVYQNFESSFSLADERSFEKIAPLAAEDGHLYLHRIRDEFTLQIEASGYNHEYLIHMARTEKSRVPLFEAIRKYCDILPTISFRQNISGLCFLVGTRLLRSQWAIVRENAKLIINCGLRSTGKSSVQCPDLFDNDYEN